MPTKTAIRLLAAACFALATATGASAAPAAGPESPLKALPLPQLETQAAAGNAAATFELGRRYSIGEGVALDKERALRYYDSAAQRSDARGEYEMARYYSGQTGAALDRQKAYDFMRRSAEHGHMPAQVDLAFIYYNGNDRVPKDLGQSFAWFGKAAAGGSVISQCLLGDFYKGGLGGAPRDPKQAFKWYSQSAGKDDRCAPKSQYELYEAYASGSGVQRDMPKAVRWLKKAANAGNPVAQARLGRAYLKGEGVPPDAELGKTWLKKSREGVAPHDDEDDDAHDHTANGHKH